MRYKPYSTFLFLFLIIISITVIVQAQDTSACPATTPLELVTGEQGRVLPGGSANRVRAVPSTSGEVLYQIEGGTVFDVIGQPECSDGYRWWRIRYAGREGWTVEGDDTGYFLEPVSDEADMVSTSTTVAAATDDCELLPRLVVGREGQLTSSTPSRVRNIPGTHGEQLGQIQPLDTFAILEGAVCADGINWWRVSVGNLEGWIAEGVNGEYFTELVEILPTPTPDYIGLPEPNEISWNSDGTLIAVGTQHDGIFIYDSTDWLQPPTQIFAGAVVHSLAFVPNNPHQIAVSVLAGDSECGETESESRSGVFVYDLSTDDISVMIRDFTGACGVDLVTQLQFNADATILITNSSGQFAAYTLPDGAFDIHIAPYDFGGFPMFDQIAISGDGSQLALAQTVDEHGYLFRVEYSDGQLVGFEDGRITEVVTALALSADGKRIFIGDAAGNLQTYSRPEDAESYSEYKAFIRGERSTTSNRINAIAIDPDGAIVTAESDPHAVVRVFEPETLVQVTTYFGGVSTSAALDLAFNPDGSLLAVLVDDTIHILDTSDYTQIAELVLQRN